jgi:NAD(P)-dependent dehydrogenase (short-subunit alcohol dehydrogenase family)
MAPVAESLSAEDGQELAGRVAIVTGAGAGLGRAHALALAAEGVKVVVNDLGGATDGTGGGHAAADAVVAEIERSGGTAVADYRSVADPANAAKIVQTAVDAWGRVDVLVNNAGVLRDRSVTKLSQADIETVIDVHLMGSFFMSQGAYAVMKDAGFGRLIHTTSAGGLFGVFGQSNYAAAKGGIAGLNRALSVEGAKYGITSNCIAPLARTRLTGDIFGPLDEMLAPDLVSPLVVYLARPTTSLTGEIISAGGGRFARIFTAFTPGVVLAPSDGRITPDAVAANIEGILDTTGFIIPPSSTEEVIHLATALMAANGATTEQSS